MMYRSILSFSEAAELGNYINLVLFFWYYQFKELPPIESACSLLQFNARRTVILSQLSGEQLVALLAQSYQNYRYQGIASVLNRVKYYLQAFENYKAALRVALMGSRNTEITLDQDKNIKPSLSAQQIAYTARVEALRYLQMIFELSDADIEEVLNSYDNDLLG